MDQAKRAWIYCRIDAPEDLHGALKRQRQQLMDYAEQMGFEVAGSSVDTGSSKQLGWPGLRLARQAATEHRIDALLLNGLSCFGIAALEALPFLGEAEAAGVAVYTPLQGKLTFKKGGSDEK